MNYFNYEMENKAMQYNLENKSMASRFQGQGHSNKPSITKHEHEATMQGLKQMQADLELLIALRNFNESIKKKKK